MSSGSFLRFLKIFKPLAMAFIALAFFPSGCSQNRPIFIKERIPNVTLDGDFRETVLSREPSDLPAQLASLVPAESWEDSFWLYSHQSVREVYHHRGSGVVFLVVDDRGEGELLRIPQMDIRAIRSVSN